MASNLEALTEEEDEEIHITESETETEDDGDGGIRKGEPNKFDAMCDGSLNSLALVHAAIHELLELKDELLRHSLPPVVLSKVALTSTKVFRSVTDMHMPLNELVRLVRIYSTPWEEKSAALKKLHEDYESKKAQLNIAVKRLQLIDAHSRRIARERRIMNWEKLFSRLTSKRGHGRRWKFLIDAFKTKAAEGISSLQQYLDEMEQDSDGEDNEEDNLETQIQQLSPSPTTDAPETEKWKISKKIKTEEDEDETEMDEASTMGKVYKDSEQESIGSSRRKGESLADIPQYIRPPMKDKEIWTNEPEYDRYLHIRVYKPEGLEHRELKAILTFGQSQMYKTGVLDLPMEEEEEEKSEEGEEDKKKGAASPPGRGRGRGLMGTRGARGGARPGAAGARKEKPKEEQKPKFEECSFSVPETPPEGVLILPRRKKEVIPDNVQIAVHYGPREDMVAMATIDMDDLDSLDLPVLLKPPPVGDAWSEGRQPPEAEFDDSSVRNLEPLNFPLYAIHTGKSDTMHEPCGQVPLMCYWAKREKPRKFDRITESETVNDIVLDETGFDMREVTKEELHKEMRDEALSAIHLTPEPDEQEQPVPKYQVAEMIDAHQQEMTMLQHEYEMRLQDVVENLQKMHEAQLASQDRRHQMLVQQLHSQQDPEGGIQYHPPPQSASGRQQMTIDVPQVPEKSNESWRSNRSAGHSSRPSSHGKPKRPPKHLSKTLPVWGEGLPNDFFERMEFFNQESQRHKSELNERTNKEVGEKIKKRLAGEFKLANEQDDYSPTDDVTLPAVFMPSKSNNMNIFNPRAHKYFHPSGAGGARLTQPPSMVQLPPIPQSKLSVCNLFSLSQQTPKGGNEALMQKYMQQQNLQQADGEVMPNTPAPTYATPQNMDTRENTLQDPSTSEMPSREEPVREAIME